MLNNDNPVSRVFKLIPTGNKSLDRDLIRVFNKYQNDTSNNSISIILELSILSALYPELTKMIL